MTFAKERVSFTIPAELTISSLGTLPRNGFR
jgi:hypothetical protein